MPLRGRSRSSPPSASRPEVLAFLQAIKENPDDDGPRLMLADWLEERGDPRGTYVRLQVEASQLPEGDERRDELVSQAQELGDRHGLDWLGPLRRGNMQCESHRGLLRVRVTGEQCREWGRWWAGAEAWAWIDQLEAEWFMGASLGKLATTPLLQTITHLDLETPGPTPNEGVNALVTSLGTCPLRSLTVRDSWGNVNPQLVVALSSADPGRFPCLRALKLQWGKLGDAEVEKLAGAQCLADLTSLGITRNNVGNSGAAALAVSPYFASLTSLNLEWNKIGHRGATALARSPYLANLRTLNLSRNRVGNAGAHAIAVSPHLKNLINLVLDE